MLSTKRSETSKSYAKVVGDNKNSILYVDPDSQSGYNKISLKGNGHIVPFPNIDEREVIYIAGKSGSGKSTYASQYIYNYLQCFPKNKVYVFSRLKMSDVLKAMGCIEIPINENLTDIDIHKDMEDALCLFDDIDTIRDKNLRDSVYAIQSDILETGRHRNIHIVITSHLINGNDKKKTRTVINEANKVTFFPRGGNQHGIKYFLQHYSGFSKKQIESIMNIPSRWITINQDYPSYIFSQKMAETEDVIGEK